MQLLYYNYGNDQKLCFHREKINNTEIIAGIIEKFSKKAMWNLFLKAMLTFYPQRVKLCNGYRIS